MVRTKFNRKGFYDINSHIEEWEVSYRVKKRRFIFETSFNELTCNSIIGGFSMTVLAVCLGNQTSHSRLKN